MNGRKSSEFWEIKNLRAAHVSITMPLVIENKNSIIKKMETL